MDQHSPNHRVVITGIGVITSIGNDIESFWTSLLAGRCGIERVGRFDPSEFTCQVSAEARDFDPLLYMDAKEVRRNDRYTQLALAAAKEAIKDGSLDVARLDKTRFGVLMGSGIGGMETFETQFERLTKMGPRKVSPFTIPSLIANMASGVVAIELGAKGPNFGIVSACSTSAHSIGEALRMIRYGDADIMLAGGSEASITRLSFAGFCSMKAMSVSRNDDPKRASRPFDKTRDGFIMGEGAGALIIESEEHARARGAHIYCELAGYAATCDAYHITSPDPSGEGLALCLNNSLKDAGLAAHEIDYINAHGTSTQLNDKTETSAVKEVFGDHAGKLLISSTKSMTGHLLGAAGAIEAAACIKVIETGEVPPTINYEVPDEDCDLNYVPNQKTSAKVRVAMSNSLGFGGHNASIILKAL